MNILQEIEKKHGRKRIKKWDDRTLDIDILIFGSIMRTDKNLSIPHPEIAKRLFVLKPLIEIVSSNFQIPGLGPVNKLLKQLEPKTLNS